MVAASREQSVKEWVEEVLGDALEREEDRGWMENDLSRLGKAEPYEWAEGELDEERPVRYEPGRGFVVEGGKQGA